jgi:hypothetical protein
VDDDTRNGLLLTASFARTLAQIASALEDPDICDSPLLYELLALGDRAEQRLAAESRLPRPPEERSD